MTEAGGRNVRSRDPSSRGRSHPSYPKSRHTPLASQPRSPAHRIMSAAASRATRRALSSVLAAAASASASASASSAGGGVAATTTTMMSSHGRGALFATTLRAATAAHHRESSSLRGFASSASASAETSSSPGIFEFRTDVVIPANRNDYLATCYEREYREARVSIHEGAFLGMWTVETGGDLNEITHVYHYRDYDHRDVVRANVKGAKDEEAWACFQADAWPYVKSMKSEVRSIHWSPYDPVGEVDADP